MRLVFTCGRSEVLGLAVRIDFDIRLVAVVLFFVSLSGCRTKVLPLLSDLKMADANTDRQLIAGFHELEADSYRWTKHRFAVILAVPAGAKTKGGLLEVNLYLPDSQIQNLGPMTLKADVNGIDLASETWSKGGAYTYTQSIPAELLKQPACSIVFTFDKSMRERVSEGRELAATVNEISLKELDSRKEGKHS